MQVSLITMCWVLGFLMQKRRDDGGGGGGDGVISSSGGSLGDSRLAKGGKDSTTNLPIAPCYRCYLPASSSNP